MAIVDSIVRYAAGAKMDAGAWNTLVVECAKSYATGEDIKDVLKSAEAEFKEMTGESSMPSAYRSAKSVLVKAYSFGIQTVDANGVALGKTAVENLIKEAKPAKEEATSSDLMEDGLALLRKGYLKCATEADQVAYRTYIDLHIGDTYL